MPIEVKFYVELLWVVRQKIVQMVLVTDQKGHHAQIW